ncbi:hypothetical protein Tco_0026550, partial [Tanacetum coccineum]
IRNFESYKEYYAIASGAEPLKTKASVKKKQVGSNKTTTPLKVKRLKTSAKAAKPAKKKQPEETSKVKGLTVLSEVPLIEAEQLKLVIERSKTQTHSSHASSSGADEGTGAIPEEDDEEVSLNDDDDDDDDDDNQDDDDDDNQDDDNQDDDNQDDDNQDDNNQDDDDQEDDDQDDDDQEHDDQDDDANDDAQDKDDQDDENQDNDNEQTDSDNNGDDFVHPKFSTHDEEEREEESFDPRVQTPSHVESTDDEDDDEEVQGVNIKDEEMDEEANNEESEGNKLYRDLNINLEGQDVEMTDAQLPYVQATREIEDTHVIITAPNNPEDVPVTTIAEPPLVPTTTLPPPPTPLITHMQQTPVPTPTTVPSSSLQDLPNFGSLFGFDHRLKTLETDFSEFKQTN